MKYANQKTKYKPDTIKYLFIFDAPPYEGDGRFYDEEATDRDNIFLTMMMALYPEEYYVDKKQKARLVEKKPLLLKRFMDDGCYVIEACKEPFIKSLPANLRFKKVVVSMNALVKEVRAMADSSTCILLISNHMFRAGAERFNSESFNVINKEMIPLPISGHKKSFIKQVRALLD